MKRIYLAALTLVVTLLAFWVFAFTPDQFIQAQGGVTNFSTLRVTNYFRANPRTVITVTNGSTIDPTGSYQRLASAAAVGTSANAVVVEPAGTILFLVNTGAQTITITETANIKSAGNIVLGTLDTAILLSDGSDYYQIGGSNN